MTLTDLMYRDAIRWITLHGQSITARNALTQSSIDLPPMIFDATPLVTLRRTAWQKAIREMEWFLSGDAKCPDDLLDWWAGQLNPNGEYLRGYGSQWRQWHGFYDQIGPLIFGLMQHPTSRRHILTTWNPLDMFNITRLNANPNTPTTCHSTVIQWFVRGGALHLSSYQRSADMLLGLPHNLIQSWALLLWIARQAGLQSGTMRWIVGDGHIYQEHSHLQAVFELLQEETRVDTHAPELIYQGGVGDDFRAADFEMMGEIPEPVTTVRPRLL